MILVEPAIFCDLLFQEISFYSRRRYFLNVTASRVHGVLEIGCCVKSCAVMNFFLAFSHGKTWHSQDFSIAILVLFQIGFYLKT